MNDIGRRAALGAGAGLLAAGLLGAGRGEAQPAFRPSRPVRLVVPFPPGGPTDLLGRLVAERLSVLWGVPVVVENRAGGGTAVGTNVVARSAPDGHVIGLVISSHVINPALRDDLPFDALRDFAHVTQMTEAHVAFVANAALPADDLRGMIALSKRTPEGLSYASPGVGSLSHLVGELLASATGANMVHIPYPGSAPAQTDLLASRVPLMFDVWHSVRSHVEAGQLKVLGLASGRPLPGWERLPLIRDIVPGIEAASMFGIVAPGGTPAPTVAALAAGIRTILLSGDMPERLRDLGMEPVASTPEAFTAYVAAEIARWRTVVRERGLKPA
ncbi:tripartite tricarboxylate transporter substrate binding protein [Muricoccus aerilatus]|uniref:tripartite tricarboxylate transporter substrate binding protein n=1 Tax=Muricoccus aerilatus TaxID=452982 RepID=UPI0005C1A27E|nr:tripartite tricarboxylate transporter substrate binding protein [Roseomonas aerilata]